MSRRRRRNQGNRKPSFVATSVFLVVFAIYATIGEWFVHHPRKWLDRYEQNFPALASALEWVGNPVSDITDSLGLTGNDCIYEYDTAAPSGEVCFAGEPERMGGPAPDDIEVVDRGEFKIGWSPSLRHPVWVAYHVTDDARYPVGERPKFSRDSQVTNCPDPGDYKRCGYDRGHMAPNYAIVTRYGEWSQKRTFLMSNISPQTAELNRGAWRELEHRIADFWTKKYGEIWVVVGCISDDANRMTIGETGIDIPQKFYMTIVAQEGYDVRALTVILPQDVPYGAYPARYLASVDELEAMTGLNFMPDLPDFIRSPLEAQLPTRLWPVRFVDVIDQFVSHYSKAF